MARRSVPQSFRAEPASRLARYHWSGARWIGVEDKAANTNDRVDGCEPQMPPSFLAHAFHWASLPDSADGEGSGQAENSGFWPGAGE